MMRGFDINGIYPRYTELRGVDARFGIGDSRPTIPPAIWSSLVVWYNTRKQNLTNADILGADPHLRDLSGHGHKLTLVDYQGTPLSGVNADGWLQSNGLAYGLATGLPLLTDYTVVANRRWIDKTESSAFASRYLDNATNSFRFEYTVVAQQRTTSYGHDTQVTFVPDGISWQTRTSYNGVPITTSNSVDYGNLVVGASRIFGVNDNRGFRGAYKSFLLFNRTLTPTEIAFVSQWMA